MNEIAIRWILGFGVSLLLGSLVSAKFSAFLHARALLEAAAKGLTFKEGYADRVTFFPRWIGVLERIFFTVVIAFAIPGVGGLVGSWIIVKMLSGWNRAQEPGAQYRMLAFAGLMGSLTSLFFGIVGGLIAGGQMCPQGN